MYETIKEDYQKETKTSIYESLTGLFNHGFLQIALDLEIQRFQRYGKTFTLALLDVDSFSKYNKQHGSLKGDLLLKTIAGIIQKNIRTIDIAARYAGDVFALILPESEPGGAVVCLERIMKAVEMSADNKATLSIGLASCPIHTIKKESLFMKAQEALSKAKITGKNRIRSFEEENVSVPQESSRILLVDDEPLNLKFLEAILLPLHYKVMKASNGESALSLVNRMDIDLILLDIMMPDMDGYEVCRRLKSSERTRMIPVIMITALDAIEDKIKGIEAGADDFISKPPNKMELLTRVKSLIKVSSFNKNLSSLENVLFSLANAVEAKDSYTIGHTNRTSKLAIALARKIGLSEKEISEVKIGGILHDIGKIGIPESILNKPGSLTSEEFEIINNHPGIGHKICLPLQQTLGMALDLILHHHEKLDGSGYPDGLKGDEIPLAVRVMTVVDIYEALSSDRAYRKAMPKERALDIIRQEVNEEKLDKQIVDSLIEMIG